MKSKQRKEHIKTIREASTQDFSPHPSPLPPPVPSPKGNDAPCERAHVALSPSNSSMNNQIGRVSKMFAVQNVPISTQINHFHWILGLQVINLQTSYLSRKGSHNSFPTQTKPRQRRRSQTSRPLSFICSFQTSRSLNHVFL